MASDCSYFIWGALTITGRGEFIQSRAAEREMAKAADCKRNLCRSMHSIQAFEETIRGSCRETGLTGAA